MQKINNMQDENITVPTQKQNQKNTCLNTTDATEKVDIKSDPTMIDFMESLINQP